MNIPIDDNGDHAIVVQTADGKKKYEEPTIDEEMDLPTATAGVPGPFTPGG